MALKANANKIQIGRARKLPVKKTINLMYKEKTRTDIVFTLLIFMLYLVALYFFSKYGVSAQLSKADAAESFFNQKLQELHALQAENNEYANVITEYSHYGNGFLTDGEVAAQDRITMLNVIDQRIHTTGGIQNIKIIDNIAQINLGVSDANMIPEIIKQLEESEYVGYVTAQTASTVDQRSNEVQVDAEGNVITPLYVDASITVNFRSPAEVEAALSNGETAVDAYLDASPTGFATGTNVYVPTIVEQPSEDAEGTEEKTEEKKDTKKEDKSSKDNKSKSSSDSKSSSSKSSSSSSSSDAKAKAQAAQKVADAQAASQQQAAAQQREQQAAQAAAQAQAQQQAASSASSQTTSIDTDTSQFGSSVTISGGSPISSSTSGSPVSSSTSGPTVGSSGSSSGADSIANSSFGPSSPLGTVDSSINPLH
ncbi:MAG: hypothetical protein J6I76_11340 [Oribacterium sp.]|nr:hypothetical protein [Oribacterium sp.]